MIWDRPGHYLGRIYCDYNIFCCLLHICIQNISAPEPQTWRALHSLFSKLFDVPVKVLEFRYRAHSAHNGELTVRPA